MFRRRSIYLHPDFLRSCGRVTALVLDIEHTENVGHLNASFVILLHLIRVSIEVVLYKVVCPAFGYV